MGFLGTQYVPVTPSAPTTYPHFASFAMGFCRQSGSVEVALAPQVAALVHVQVWPIIGLTLETNVALESRFYLPKAELPDFAASASSSSLRREFISARISSRGNIGVVCGIKFLAGLPSTVHMGGYYHGSKREIHPTLGVSFSWEF